jgi:CRP-like cAMP-binding protein
MSTPKQIGRQNRLLSELPRQEYERLIPHLRPVSLELRQIIFRPDDCIQQVHFPTTSIISFLTELSDGSGMEVGLVGYEGMAGVSAILGGTETKLATVQAQGEALTMNADVLRDEFRRGGAFQVSLLRYTHALMAQISQSAVCSVRHSVAARLSRWLLMYHDRLERDEFELTHEFMAAMLGVRRASISEVAMKLQEKGFITYERGHIRIIDRLGMEQFVCECYSVVKEFFDNLRISAQRQ